MGDGCCGTEKKEEKETKKTESCGTEKKSADSCTTEQKAKEKSDSCCSN